jgi:acetyl-CoA carboxylase biotin carboxyl carrier protein
VSSSQDAIKRVVEAFERSDWSEIDVRMGDVRVHLSTGAAGDGATPGVQGLTPEHVAPADTRAAGDAAPATAAASDAAPAGAQLVVSPSPGILWRSPEPGLPPFAEVGGVVQASATVCIVEVMKLMNHVKAGVSGEVVAVYGVNGAAVEKGQALFAIAPFGASS